MLFFQNLLHHTTMADHNWSMSVSMFKQLIALDDSFSGHNYRSSLPVWHNSPTDITLEQRYPTALTVDCSPISEKQQVLLDQDDEEEPEHEKEYDEQEVTLRNMLHAAVTNKGSNVLMLSSRHMVVMVFVGQFSCISTQHIILRLCEQLLQLHMLNTIPIVVYRGKSTTLSKFLKSIDHPLVPELHFVWDHDGVLANCKYFAIRKLSLQNRLHPSLLFDNETKRRKRDIQRDLKCAAFLRGPVTSGKWKSLRSYKLPASFIIVDGQVVDQFKPNQAFAKFDFVKQVLLPGIVSRSQETALHPLDLIQAQKNAQLSNCVALSESRSRIRSSLPKSHSRISDTAHSPLLSPMTELVPSNSEIETNFPNVRKSTPQSPYRSPLKTFFEPLDYEYRSTSVSTMKKMRTRSRSFPEINTGDMELDDVLLDDTCRRYYKLHVAREHCIETVLFYEHVELQYKKCKSVQQRRKLAETIIERFLNPDGMYGLNISLELRDKVKTEFGRSGPISDLFQPVMNHVRATCALDSFLRFKLSDLWIEMMKARQYNR